MQPALSSTTKIAARPVQTDVFIPACVQPVDVYLIIIIIYCAAMLYYEITRRRDVLVPYFAVIANLLHLTVSKDHL